MVSLRGWLNGTKNKPEEPANLPSTVPDLHPWPGAGVSRVSRADKVSPLLSRQRLGSTSTLVVPHASSREASVGDTGERRAGGKEIGIGAHEDVGHHRTRRRASREHPVLIDAMVLNGKTHSAGNSQRVSSSIVGEGSVGVDIPASSAVGGVRVEDDEGLVLVGEVGVLGAAEVRLGSTRAVVHCDDQSRVGDDASRLVEVHPHIGGVGAEAVDLLQLVLGSEGAADCEEQRCGDDFEESEHFDRGIRRVSGWRVRADPVVIL